MKKKYRWMTIVNNVLTVPNKNIQRHLTNGVVYGDNYYGFDSEEDAVKAFEEVSSKFTQELILVTVYG